MTIHSETNVNVTLGRQKQATWGTRLTDPSLTQRLPMISSDLGKQRPIHYNNENEVGKGHSYPTALTIVGHEYSRPFNYHLGSWIAAFVGAFGLGKITTTGPADTAAYTHVCLPSLRGDDNGQLPFFTIVEENDGDDWYRSDLVINGFSISGQIGDDASAIMPTIAFDVIGSGREADGSGFSTPAQAADDRLYLTGLQFQLGVAGALVDLSSRLRSFNIGHQNNLDVGNSRTANCGLYRSQLLYGEQRPDSLEFTILRSGITELTQLKAATQLQASFTFTGAALIAGCAATYPSLTVTFTALQLADVDATFDNKRGLFVVKPVPLYTAADQGSIRWTVVNGASGFAIAEA